MDNKELNLWKEAGKIAAEALEFSTHIIKENSKILDIVEKIENFILKKASLAFPVMISINENAAHQTAFPNDETILKKGDLVKIDIGTSVNGYIGDTAKTIEVKTNNHKELIKASEKALKNSIKIIKPDIKLKEIGQEIQQTIESFNLQPIKNLTGHVIEQYILHSGISIPNYNNNEEFALKKNTVIAIEPFATYGIGLIKESKPSTIYRLLTIKPIRSPTSRQVLSYIQENYKTLPFCKRHLLKKFNQTQLALALNDLEKNKIIYQYPILPEKTNALVSQAEHTVIIKDKPIVTTKKED